MQVSMVTSWLLVSLLIIFSSVDSRVFIGPSFWENLAEEELTVVLKHKVNNKVAKNVILFLGSGMGAATITAGRFYKGQKNGKHGETESLSFENFPYVGMSKTYNSDRQVPDSGSSATAVLTGVKTNQNTVGVDDRVKLNDCQRSLDEKTHLFSILSWAQDARKNTGIVSNSRLTRGSVAAAYAHSANKAWECDGAMPNNASKCMDIARQLIENQEGKHLKVIFGGGRQCFLDKKPVQGYDPNICLRKDTRNLISDWEREKKRRNVRHKYIQTRKELVSLDPNSIEYVLGLFDNGDLPYEYQQKNDLDGTPYLTEMVDTAINILQKGSDGFLLIVEVGLIDEALHSGAAHVALEELVSLDTAVGMALKKVNLDETLVIVTTDHSQSLSFVGYPESGSNILGMAGISDVDNLPYTSLQFATGPGYNHTAKSRLSIRPNLTSINTDDYKYKYQAAVPLKRAAHGGEDVPIYAIGPRSHIFTGVHEQNYIARAIKFASCIGRMECSSVSTVTTSSYLISLLFVSSKLLIY